MELRVIRRDEVQLSLRASQLLKQTALLGFLSPEYASPVVQDSVFFIKTNVS